MADVENLSKPPPGYEPLPTADPSLPKEKYEGEDDHEAPRPISKRLTFARHLLRLSAILGLVSAVVCGRYLWHACRQHFKNLDEDGYVGGIYRSAGDIEPHYPHHLHHPHHHFKPNCTVWKGSTAPEGATYSFKVSTAAEVIKLVSGGGFQGAVDYVVSDSKSLESIGVEVTLSAPAVKDVVETTSGPHWWLPKKKWHHKHPKAYVCSIHTPEDEVKGVVLSRKPPHHRHGHRHHHPPSHPRLPPGHLQPPLPEVPDHDHNHDHSLDSPMHNGEDYELFDWVDDGKKHPHHRHHCPRRFVPVNAKVVVTIPRGHLKLGSFSSVFPGLVQNINGAFDNVVFKRLFIVGATSGLHNVKADHASISAGTHPIKGSFLVKDHLDIVTAKAPIEVDVTLLSNTTARRPTRLSLVNFNGSIHADVKLVAVDVDSIAKAKSNGFFAIHAITMNAPVDVKVISLPTDARLNLRAGNRFAPIFASVPPSYEGKFALITTKGQSIVKIDKDSQDPEDGGRKRQFNVRSITGGIVVGNVEWVESKKDAVTVEAKVGEEIESDWMEGKGCHDECNALAEEACDCLFGSEEVGARARSKIDLVSTDTDVELNLN